MNIGVVVIGRNEGERLKRCLESLARVYGRVVYVDSGSTDRSVELARAMEVDVVDLDMRIPFTAARARNEGFKRLREIDPELSYVQFVDGDCEIAIGWPSKAEAFLNSQIDVAVVCGRLREKYPEHSVYNMLCDIEWDTPIGEAKACGGIAMMRVCAFESAKGFSPDLIAGEEPELCVRLRAKGWRIWRLDAEMALHDAAMTRLRQWWKRTMRSGYAYAQARYLHGATAERHGVKESRSAWFWGFVLPLGAITAAFLGPSHWALILLLIYPTQIVRLAMRGGRTSKSNWWRAWFLVLGKFPEMFGQIKFLYHSRLRIQPRLIEHK